MIQTNGAGSTKSGATMACVAIVVKRQMMAPNAMHTLKHDGKETGGGQQRKSMRESAA